MAFKQYTLCVYAVEEHDALVTALYTLIQSYQAVLNSGIASPALREFATVKMLSAQALIEQIPIQ